MVFCQERRSGNTREQPRDGPAVEGTGVGIGARDGDCVVKLWEEEISRPQMVILFFSL